MKRARQRTSTLLVPRAKPRAPELAAALRAKGGGAHGKSEKALRRAARVALQRAGDEN